MKEKLFTEDNHTTESLVSALEASNCGVEEIELVRHYNEYQLEEMEKQYIEDSKKLSALKTKLEALQAPILEEMKPLKKSTVLTVSKLNIGGEKVTEKVYCFPSGDTNLMGLYDKTGTLVSTRQMTKNERQLHINTLTATRIAQ